MVTVHPLIDEISDFDRGFCPNNKYHEPFAISSQVGASALHKSSLHDGQIEIPVVAWNINSGRLVVEMFAVCIYRTADLGNSFYWRT
jgi:hypothetical protein